MKERIEEHARAQQARRAQKREQGGFTDRLLSIEETLRFQQLYGTANWTGERTDEGVRYRFAGFEDEEPEAPSGDGAAARHPAPPRSRPVQAALFERVEQTGYRPTKTLRAAEATRNAAHADIRRDEPGAGSVHAGYELERQLGNRQAEVLAALRKVPDATNTELSRRLQWPINRITPRVYELREMGLVEEAEKRACRVTGREVQAWRAASEGGE